MSTQDTSPTPSRRIKTMSPDLLTPDNFEYDSKFSRLVREQTSEQLLNKQSKKKIMSPKPEAMVSEVDALNNILSNINVHNEGKQAAR